MYYPFVKLNKNILNEEIFKNEKILKFYIWLLCNAAYKESDIMVGRQNVHLNKGEVVIGLKKTGAELSISVHNLRNKIGARKWANKIAIKATNKFSVVTLLDKEIFTIHNNKTGTQTGTQNDNQTGNNKEYKEIKNNKTLLFAAQKNKKQTDTSYAGYDIELYERMLNEED